MIGPRIVRRPDGGYRMEQITYGLALWLAEMPELLGSDQPPAVRRRLYPAPSDDEQMREEWERLMVPELFSLLASARDIARKDLQPLVQRLLDAEDMFEDGVLVIPPEHVKGWISALNAARLALGALHAVEAEDLAEDREPVRFDAREAAIARIEVFAWFQGSLIHGTHPPPEDEEDEPGDVTATP